MCDCAYEHMGLFAYNRTDWTIYVCQRCFFNVCEVFLLYVVFKTVLCLVKYPNICSFSLGQGSQCYDDLIVVINHLWMLHMQCTPHNVTSSCTFLTAENSMERQRRKNRPLALHMLSFIPFKESTLPY